MLKANNRIVECDSIVFSDSWTRTNCSIPLLESKCTIQSKNRISDSEQLTLYQDDKQVFTGKVSIIDNKIQIPIRRILYSRFPFTDLASVKHATVVSNRIHEFIITGFIIVGDSVVFFNRKEKMFTVSSSGKNLIIRGCPVALFIDNIICTP